MPLKLWDLFCAPAVVHTSHFDCASHFEEQQKSLLKFYHEFWRNFEKKMCILPDLNHFFPHWQTVSSRMLIETLHSGDFICYMYLTLWGL